MMLFNCAILLLAIKVHFLHGNDAFVAFKTGKADFKCESKHVPVWSWFGKDPTKLITMAIGVKKQNRFTESRYTCNFRPSQRKMYERRA